MKLQGASVLDLVGELVIRLAAMEKTSLIGERLGTILVECGHEPIEVFERILGPEAGQRAAAAAANEINPPKNTDGKSRRT